MLNFVLVSRQCTTVPELKLKVASLFLCEMSRYSNESLFVHVCTVLNIFPSFLALSVCLHSAKYLGYSQLFPVSYFLKCHVNKKPGSHILGWGIRET